MIDGCFFASFLLRLTVHKSTKRCIKITTVELLITVTSKVFLKTSSLSVSNERSYLKYTLNKDSPEWSHLKTTATRHYAKKRPDTNNGLSAVSYTHLTLPTICSV